MAVWISRVLWLPWPLASITGSLISTAQVLLTLEQLKSFSFKKVWSRSSSTGMGSPNVQQTQRKLTYTPSSTFLQVVTQISYSLRCEPPFLLQICNRFGRAYTHPCRIIFMNEQWLVRLLICLPANDGFLNLIKKLLLWENKTNILWMNNPDNIQPSVQNRRLVWVIDGWHSIWARQWYTVTRIWYFTGYTQILPPWFKVNLILY